MKEQIEQLILEHSKPENRLQDLYHYVQSFPYEIIFYQEPPDLVKYGRGGCKIKHMLLYEMFTALGYQARLEKILFDWADLPIPSEVLKKLQKSGTISPHIALSLDLERNNTLIVDATWDPGLEKIGFPVTKYWDGKSSTLAVTKGKVKTITEEEYLQIVSVDNLAEKEEFFRALNDFLGKVRGEY